ncbi:MAG: hypothetical protein AVDCRST_MAG73-2058, partial [uncultured Thermomicrobiales bacterium]
PNPNRNPSSARPRATRSTPPTTGNRNPRSSSFCAND